MISISMCGDPRAARQRVGGRDRSLGGLPRLNPTPLPPFVGEQGGVGSMAGPGADRRTVLGATLSLLIPATRARSAETMPPPVRGITFDEWTSANARLAAGRALRDVLAVLGASEADWNAANEAYLAALRTAEPGGPVMARYGEVFGSPNAGRFAGTGEAPKPAVIGTAEEFLRVQAELTAAGEVGQDPTQVLRERFNLTPLDYAEAGTRWTRHVADLAHADPRGLRAWNAMRETALAEARRRYASGGDKRDGG